MNYGPVDLVAVQFPENKFTGAILDELQSLSDQGIVRVLDIIFVTTDDAGDVTVLEVTDLDDPVAVMFDAFVGDIDALLSQDDATTIGSSLPPNASAALVLYENVWATKMSAAVREAGGEVLLSERIPRDIIDAMQEEIESEA